MNAQQIEELVSLQRTFFETGTTLSLDFRLQSLKKLHDVIRRMEPQINAALQSDLGKSATETYMCETGMTLSGFPICGGICAALPKTAMC